MIRYYASTILIGTTEGNLPKELFTAHDDGIAGIELRTDPLHRSRIKAPFWSFMAALEHIDPILDECSLAAHTEWLRRWDKAVKAAETPPVKIAKPGEVWECTGRLFDMPAGMYSVGFCSVKVPLVMYCMDTGVHRVAGQLVDSGIQLESPSDWKCHGPLAEFIAKGKA